MPAGTQRKIRLPADALLGRLTAIYHPRRDLDPDAKPPDGMGAQRSRSEPHVQEPPSSQPSSSVALFLRGTRKAQPLQTATVLKAPLSGFIRFAATALGLRRLPANPRGQHLRPMKPEITFGGLALVTTRASALRAEQFRKFVRQTRGPPHRKACARGSYEVQFAQGDFRMHPAAASSL